MDTAFIGLDYIFDIVHPDGKLWGFSRGAEGRDVIAKVNRALAIARGRGWLTALVKVGFEPGYINHPPASPFFGPARDAAALELGTPGTDFHPDLDLTLADVVVSKPRVSAFYGTQLESILRARRIERLVISGVSTAWAVQSAARDAHDRDYQVVVAEDACAAADKGEHDASIRLLSMIAQVVKVEDLLGL